jgi:hypothetical protein
MLQESRKFIATHLFFNIKLLQFCTIFHKLLSCRHEENDDGWNFTAREAVDSEDIGGTPGQNHIMKLSTIYMHFIVIPPTAAGYGLDDRGSIPGSGSFFCVGHHVQTGSLYFHLIVYVVICSCNFHFDFICLLYTTLHPTVCYETCGKEEIHT